MKFKPFKTPAPSPAAQAEKTIKALLLAPSVAEQILKTDRAEAEREAILYLYSERLLASLPLEIAFAVGSAALNAAHRGAGDLYLRWQKTRLTSPTPSLNEIIEGFIQEEIEATREWGKQQAAEA